MSTITKSPSVTILKQKIKELKMNNTSFSKAVGMSREYISKVLNYKQPFPKKRETLEKLAKVCGIDPHEFSEYSILEKNLSESTLKLWKQMSKLGISRKELAEKLKGQIDKTHLYGILNGELRFPQHIVLIERLAKSVNLNPTVFKEYKTALLKKKDNKADNKIVTTFINMLFDKMMISKGYCDSERPLPRIPEFMMDLFLDDKEYDPKVKELFKLMGEKRMNITTLSKKAKVSEDDLRLLVFGRIKPEKANKLIDSVMKIFK